MKRISITAGNACHLYIPVVLLSSSGTEVADLNLLDVTARVGNDCNGYDEFSVEKVDNCVVISLPYNLPVGTYNVEIKGTYDARAVALVIAGKLAIVSNDEQANWADYLQGDRVDVDTQFFVAGAYVDDAELERLKAEYIAAKQAADAATLAAQTAKAEAEEVSYRAVEMLEGGIAQQATSDDILQAVNGISTTMYRGVLNVAQSANIVTIAPNNRNIWQSVDGELAVTLAGALAGIVNEYILTFVVGDGFSLSIVTDAEIKWFGGDVPTWESGKTYEISIVVENDKALILWAKF